MDKKPHRILKRVLFVIAILLLLVIIAGASAVIWYQSNISAKYDVACSKEECVPQKFVVASGDSAQSIAERLESEGIIKSAFAFRIYLTLQASNKNLLPGDYMLTKSMSVEQIVQAMNNGIARPTVFIPGRDYSWRRKCVRCAQSPHCSRLQRGGSRCRT